MGPDGTPPDENDVGYLEITTRHASERIAMLRAFAKSETQARTDPLTGLWNRRSLENRVRELARDAIPYAARVRRPRPLQDPQRHPRPRSRRPGTPPLRASPARLRPTRRHHRPLRRRRVRHRSTRLPNPDCNQDPRTPTRTARPHPHQRPRPAFTVSFGVASSTDADTVRRSRRHRRPSAPHRQSRRPQPHSPRHRPQHRSRTRHRRTDTSLEKRSVVPLSDRLAYPACIRRTPNDSASRNRRSDTPHGRGASRIVWSCVGWDVDELHD